MGYVVGKHDICISHDSLNRFVFFSSGKVYAVGGVAVIVRGSVRMGFSFRVFWIRCCDIG